MKRWGGDGASLTSAWLTNTTPVVKPWRVGDACFIAYVRIVRVVSSDALLGIAPQGLDVEFRQSRPPLRTKEEAVEQAMRWLRDLTPADKEIAMGYVVRYRVMSLDSIGDILKADPPPCGTAPEWISPDPRNL